MVARMRRDRRRGIIAALLLIMLLCGGSSLVFRPAPVLRVTFLDVGQGDSIVIESPSGKVVVIDTGNIIDEGADDQGRRVVAPYLRWRGINKIDYLILTHPDADHIGGAATLLHEFRVENLLENGQFGKTETALVRAIFREAQRQNTMIRIARREQRIQLGDGTNFTVLAPTDAMMSGSTNDASIVLRLDYGRKSFLFTGDAGETEEADLVATRQPLAADVLKAGHHGSKHSTTPAFLNAVQPRAVVFSCGKNNSYSHPHPDVVKRVQETGASVFRTDTQGAIVFTSDGVTLNAKQTLPKENR